MMTLTHITHSDTKQRYGSEETLPLLIIDSPLCSAVISLYGGQILEFQAKNKQPLLWLSPLAIFQQGKAIRGGVPICAPWFGAYRGEQSPNTTYPSHGFARTSIWQEHSISAQDDDTIHVCLALLDNSVTNAIYPAQFRMEINFILSDTLSIEFSIANTGDKALKCEWALHSYFAIDDIAKTSIAGLENQEYVDSANDGKIECLTDALTFDGQVDRYFIKSTESQTIQNSTPVSVSGTNCNSVITWNPGAKLAANMADISEQYYAQFVCLERGAIFDNQWHIEPMQSQTARIMLGN